MIGLGLGIARLQKSGGGGGGDADAAALIAAMSPAPDGARQTLIQNLVSGLKTDGVWAKLDVLWVLAAHGAQPARLNWKNPAAYSLTLVGDPAFTSDRGYLTFDASNYVDTGWNPTSFAGGFTQNNNSLGVWVQSTHSDVASSNNRFAIGGGGAGAVYSAIEPWRSGNDPGFWNNDNAAYATTGISTRVGFTSGQRTAASGPGCMDVFRNGVALANNGTYWTAITLVNNTMFIGCYNSGGTPSGVASDRVGVAYFGAAMTAGQQLALYNRLQTYMTAVGA